MRPDMKKVIIERPRVGGLQRRKKKVNIRPYDFDGESDYGPRRERITGGVEFRRKMQTDLWGPLFRFLNKQVGRKWNDIWADVCRHNKDFMGQHLKRHILEVVEMNVTRNSDGELIDDKGYKLFAFRNSLYYIEPETNTLQVLPAQVRRQKRKPTSPIVNFQGKKYCKHEGIWYEVTVVKFQRDDYTRHLWFPHDVFDVFGKWPNIDLACLLRAYGDFVYCSSKRQVNSRIAKRLNALLETDV